MSTTGKTASFVIIDDPMPRGGTDQLSPYAKNQLIEWLRNTCPKVRNAQGGVVGEVAGVIIGVGDTHEGKVQVSVQITDPELLKMINTPPPSI